MRQRIRSIARFGVGLILGGLTGAIVGALAGVGIALLIGLI